MTLHNAGSSAGFNIALKREGEKRIIIIKKRNYHNTYRIKKGRGKKNNNNKTEIITTQGIHIWSPIQYVSPSSQDRPQM